MTARQINFMLWTATTAVTSAAIVVLASALFLPIETPQASSSPPLASIAPSDAAKQDIFDGDPLVWSRPLRNLSGETIVPTQPVAQGEEGLRLRLVGTVGHSLALLATPEGAVVVRGIGESLAGAEVIAVEPLRVELRYNGKAVTLTKPPPATDGS